jgi:hypothetical protein
MNNKKPRERNKLRLLERKAIKAAKLRGHNMSRPEPRGKKGMMRSYSYCRTCAMTMMMDEHPQPNGISIGGEALALNCKEG